MQIIQELDRADHLEVLLLLGELNQDVDRLVERGFLDFWDDPPLDVGQFDQTIPIREQVERVIGGLMFQQGTQYFEDQSFAGVVHFVEIIFLKLDQSYKGVVKLLASASHYHPSSLNILRKYLEYCQVEVYPFGILDVREFVEHVGNCVHFEG